MIRSRMLLATVFAVSAVALAGCSSTPDAPAATSAPTAPPPTSQVETPQPDPAPEHTADMPDLTCETLISEAVSTTLLDQGWKPSQAPLHIAETEVPDGMLCTWGPADVIVGTEGQMYGFGLLDEKLSAQAQEQLTKQKWTSEKTDEGVYMSAPAAPPAPPAPAPSSSTAASPGATATPAAPATTTAPPASAAMDGFTYLFGDGWVKFADKRDGIILIQAG